MSHSEPRLQRAVPADLPVLIPLVRACHDFEQVDMTDREREAVVAPLLGAGNPQGRIWLALTGPECVGYIALTFGYSIEFRGRDAFVDELFVLQPYRGSGIGSGLLDHAKAEAAMLGVRALHLEVARDNAGARRLYQRWGFRSRTHYHLMSCPLAPGPGS